MIIETVINNNKVSVPDELVARYDLPLPRYTSYPTAPLWSEDVSAKDLSETLSAWPNKQPLSLYLHIPFCRIGCHFCGCHSIVTKNSQIVSDYLTALKNEISQIANTLSPDCSVQEIHLGGGSPNSLSNSQMEELFVSLRSSFNIDAGAEISIEADPRATSAEQLGVWSDLGINRLSLGVQDTNPDVQKAIGRVQPKEKIDELVRTARSLGFHGINFDLVYGLPLQTPASFSKTIDEVVQLAPDRIALFNFAYLPKLKTHQRHIRENDLPGPNEKFAIFCRSISELQQASFTFVGMDHFAKKDDPLSIAAASGRLNRNFQGYTTMRDLPVIGLGVTGISDLGHIYLQNEKKLNRYIKTSNSGHFASTRGYRLSDEDVLRRRIIRDLFCNNTVLKEQHSVHFDRLFAHELKLLEPLEKDGLVDLKKNEISVTPLGRLFIRNIAVLFDSYFNKKVSNIFSRSV